MLPQFPDELFVKAKAISDMSNEFEEKHGRVDPGSQAWCSALRGPAMVDVSHVKPNRRTLFWDGDLGEANLGHAGPLQTGFPFD